MIISWVKRIWGLEGKVIVMGWGSADFIDWGGGKVKYMANSLTRKHPLFIFSRDAVWPSELLFVSTLHFLFCFQAV